MSFIEKVKGLKKIKTEYIVVAALAAIVVAIVLYGFGNKTATGKSDVDDKTLAYVCRLEDELGDALSKVDGAGKVKVVITVSSGIRSEYAEDVKKTSDENKTTETRSLVLVGGKPVVLREIYPDITGVLVVADGADNIVVKMAILDAATTVLGIPCDKVKILAQ